MKEKIASLLIRILAATWRYRLTGDSAATPAVVAFWHGEMLPVWKYYAASGAAGVTSLSKDGDILAQLLSDWGYDVLRGSSSRGGKEVLEEMVGHAKHQRLLVTPDGPRGPVGIFKPGALICAQRAEVPLHIVEVECAYCLRLKKSWDRFMIPLPFARIHMNIRAPLWVSPQASREEIDSMLQLLSVQTAPQDIEATE